MNAGHRVGLERAAVVVGAGAGLLGADRRAVCTLLTDVAHALGGTVGATRAVVDAGWFGRERLVGASGVGIDPALYLGLGVSGASFHEVGRPMHVVSVNTDPAAPLSRRADLALRTDGVALLTALTTRLPNQRASRVGTTGATGVGASASGAGSSAGAELPGGGHRRADEAVPGVDLVVPVGTAHERLRMLIGAPPGPVRPAAALDADAAADALLDFLTAHGYLEGSGG